MFDATTRTAADVGSSSLSRIEARSSLPKCLADHQLISFIAEGSYGDVFLAQNRLTGQYRAIKIIWKQSCGEGRAFRRELEAIKKYEPISRSHPGFVHILHVGEIEEALFYVMELADDMRRGQEIDPRQYAPKTLHKVQLTPQACVSVGIDLTNALTELHGHGLLHRDIKPSNIVLINGRPKLADLGLVTDAGGTLSFVGTDGFVAPEGPNTFQAEIFSLGKTLYELATGKDRHEFPELPNQLRPDGILLELNEIILRACDPKPARRYRDAKAMRKELLLLESGRSIQKLRKLQRQFRYAMSAAAALFACAILVFGLYVRGEKIKRVIAEEQQRRFGVLLARGNEGLQRGDYVTALRNYVPLALRDTEGERDHLVRLGTILTRSVIPTNEWDSAIRARTFSGDGLLFAAADEAEIRIHNSVTGSEVWKTAPGADHLALSFDGGLLASAVGSGVFLHEWQDGRKESLRFDSPVRSISFSGERLSITLANRLFVIESDGSRREAPLEGTTFRSFLSPSGKIVVSSIYDNSPVLLDLASSNRLADPPNGQLTYHATFSADETTVLLANFDHAAVAWHIGLGVQIGYMPHQDGVTKAIFIPGLDIIATAGLDRTVRLWEAKTYQPLAENHTLPTDDRVVDLAFVPPFSLVSAGSAGTNIVWDLSPLRNTFAERSSKVDLPTPKQIDGPSWFKAEGTSVAGSVRGKRFNMSFADQVEAIALNEAHSVLAVGTLDQLINPHTVKLVSLNTSSIVKELPHRDGIRFVTFSPDGSKLLACDEDFLAILWDWEKGRPAIPPLRHQGQVSWAAFSETGDWIATATSDRTVKVWDAKTGDPITPPMKCPVRLQYVAFGANEESLIAANVYAAFEVPLTKVHPDSLSPLLRRYLSVDEAFR